MQLTWLAMVKSKNHRHTTSNYFFLGLRAFVVVLTEVLPVFLFLVVVLVVELLSF